MAIGKELTGSRASYVDDPPSHRLLSSQLPFSPLRHWSAKRVKSRERDGQRQDPEMFHEELYRSLAVALAPVLGCGVFSCSGSGSARGIFTSG